jgi:hypothetical protein
MKIATLSQRTLSDDALTRVSYLIDIFKPLFILHSEPFANSWVNGPNTEPIFEGQTPLAYMIKGGIPAMHIVRRKLGDSAMAQS